MNNHGMLYLAVALLGLSSLFQAERVSGLRDRIEALEATRPNTQTEQERP